MFLSGIELKAFGIVIFTQSKIVISFIPSSLYSSSQKVGNVIILVVSIFVLKGRVEGGIVGLVRIRNWAHVRLQLLVEAGYFRHKCRIWAHNSTVVFSEENKK